MSLVVGNRSDGGRWHRRALRRQGISLIEVLGAVAIIWLCFSFVMPLITSSRRSAERQLAVTEVVSVAQALQEYRNTYGFWPGQTQGVADVVYGVANGPTTEAIWQALLDNPRQLSFLDIDEDALLNGEFYDPWGRPYLLIMDENGDGRVDVKIEGVIATSVSVGAVAMAYGQDTDAVRIRSWDASGRPE